MAANYKRFLVENQLIIKCFLINLNTVIQYNRKQHNQLNMACWGTNQGGRGWLAFGDYSRIHQSFRRARICKFSRQKHRFLIAEKQAICGCQKTCTHTGTFPQTPFLMFRYVLWLCTGCQRTYTHTQTRSLKHSLRCLDMHFYSTKQTCSFKRPSLKVGSPKVLRKSQRDLDTPRKSQTVPERALEIPRESHR